MTPALVLKSLPSPELEDIINIFTNVYMQMVFFSVRVSTAVFLSVVRNPVVSQSLFSLYYQIRADAQHLGVVVQRSNS